jgi:hypothetical protein
MKKKFVQDRYFFKFLILILFGVLIGLIIKYSFSSILKEKKILCDIEKKLTINGPIDNLEIIGTKDFVNKKIIIISFTKNNDQIWGHFIYNNIKANYFKFETYYITSYGEELSTNIIIIDDYIYRVKCTISGDIAIFRIY